LAKGIKIGLVVMFIALAGGGLYLYFNPKKALHIILPDVSDIEHVHIKLTNDTAFIDLDLDVNNKGIFKIHIDTLAYRVQLDTSTLLAKSEFVDLQLSKGQRDSIHLPLALPYKRLMKKIKSLQGQDSVDIPIDVRVVYSTVFGKAALPYSKTLRIEVPRPPKFEVEKFEYVRRHKKDFYFNAHIKMHNYGKIELNVSGLKYTMVVKGLFTAKGSDLKKIHIKPQSVISAVLPIKVEFKSMVKTLGVFLKKEKVNYHLKVTGFIQNDKLGEDKTPVEIEKDGMFKLKK
jgi:LEA14-like dessication related protein